MKYEKSCGAIVIDNQKVLIVKHNKGHWDFPKGHMDEGETEVQTAIREVKEETNIDIKIDEKKRYMVSYSPKEGKYKDVVFFVASKVGGEILPQLTEVEKVEWISFEKAKEIITFDLNRELFKKVLKDLNI